MDAYTVGDIVPPLELMTSADERFMREALKEAKKAFDSDEVPVGAILVMDNEIIARGYNQVEMLQDATAHAELLCITAAESALSSWRLAGCTLYSTLEPCTMCAGAMLLSRVSRLVWGAKDIRHGAHGSWINIFEHVHPTHTMEITSGVLASWCEIPMKAFFQQKRKRRLNE